LSSARSIHLPVEWFNLNSSDGSFLRNYRYNWGCFVSTTGCATQGVQMSYSFLMRTFNLAVIKTEQYLPLCESCDCFVTIATRVHLKIVQKFEFFLMSIESFIYILRCKVCEKINPILNYSYLILSFKYLYAFCRFVLSYQYNDFHHTFDRNTLHI